ncbi:MAG: YbgC/FadM family acyl-CoA thioesterase [Rhizobiaceae bacterium]|jgi:acyl-CoA thioester hydrolase|nr:YbgC/FadM family acyl-CoA thioesterase [Rhizobiaceae bacterium]
MSRENTALANRLIDNGHEMEVRVYYEDTDFSGVVYHSNYLKFMERSRTEWLRHLEIFHTDLAEDDSAFAIHRMALKFGPPAVIDDLLTVRTILQKLTGARSFLRQEVLRREADGSETMLCGADVEVAFINHGGGAKRFPDDLRAKLGG